MADYDVECFRTKYFEVKGRELKRVFRDWFLSREWGKKKGLEYELR